MSFRRDESGQMLVLVALSMTVLLGFLALAVDVGLLFRAKRNMQVAADAAAVAGALEYKFNANVTTAKSTAQTAATANGVTNGTNGAVVTINVPPVNGPYTGITGYVEAIVSQPTNTFFMKISKITSVTVAARAVVGSGNTSGCVWALAKSGTDISLTGSGAFTAPNCNIYDDSSSSNALTLTGSGSITGKAIGIAGGYNKTGSGTLSPTPTTGIAPAADPLAGLAPPTTITGNFAPTGSGAVTLGAGQYIVKGNLSLTGSGNLTAKGVTFYTTGTTSITGSGGMDLEAPTSGDYNGVLFYQDRSDSHAISFTGSSGNKIQGIFYAADAAMTLTGSGSVSMAADFIADSISLTGSGTIADAGYSSVNAGSVLSRTAMVE